VIAAAEDGPTSDPASAADPSASHTTGPTTTATGTNTVTQPPAVTLARLLHDWG
jgi:hypothetical protein